MNKAAKVKLSLRKLFIATLAIGPLAILPSPLWALPTTAQYDVTNGSATLATGAGTANFTVSDRTVLVWKGNDTGANNTFTIPSGETWTFSGLSSTGAVLNKVGYKTDGSTNGLATATITGNLNSPGKVFVLVNGNIVVTGGASIDTAGLVLSTLNESSDFAFTTQGNLSFSGAVPSGSGNITLGNNTTTVGVTTGGLVAAGNLVAVNALTVVGDLLINQTNSGGSFVPTTSLTGLSNVTVTTNNGAIGSNVEQWSVANGLTTLTTNGNVAITVNKSTNDFKTIAVSAGTGVGGNVTIQDANVIVLSNSTVGQDLVVTAAGISATGGISTSGTLAITGNAAFTTTNANSTVSISNNSSVGGMLNMTSSNSTLSFNGVGNVNLGNIVSGSGSRAQISITTNGSLAVGNNVTALGNSVSLTAANITQSTNTGTSLGTVSSNNSSVSFNATSGNIQTGNISSTTVTLNASSGSINPSGQPTGTVITTSNTTGTSVVKTSSSGNANLSNANALAAGQIVQFTGGNLTLTDSNSMVLGTTNATGTVNLTNTAAAGVVLGTGSGTSGQNITVSGNLIVNASNAAGTITDNDYTAFNVFGAVNLTTGGGNITLDAARANGSLAPSVQLGAVSANAGTGSVILAETSTLNLGNIVAANLTAYSVGAGIVQSGSITTTSSTTAQVGSTGTIALGNTSNSFTNLTLTGGTDASATSNGASVSIIGGSTAPANVTLTSTTSGNIVLTSGTFANLTVNSGKVLDVAGTISVTGNLALSAGGSTNVAQASLPASFTPSISATLNTTTSTVTAASVTGNSRLLSYSTAPTVDFSTSTAGTTPAATATLDSFGAISGINITNAGATVTAISPVTLIGGVVTSNITQSAGKFIVAGTTTVNSPALLSGANEFSSVVLGNVSGAVLVNDVNDVTVSGAASGLTTAIAGGTGASIANTWALSLGNLNVGSLTGVASNGGGGNSGSITQVSGSALHSENTASFTTSTGNIIVANAGNSAGRVQLSTGGGNSTITYAEDGTVKLGNISNGNGTVTITARNGSIIEDTSANNRYSVNATTSFQAPNGSIAIGNVTMNGTGFTTDGNLTAITANAPAGSVALISNTTNLTLSTLNANSLVVTHTGTGNLTQSGAATIFGSANITGAGNITLGNTSNNFGPIIITSSTANKNVSIVESGTMNLRTVSMNGTSNGTFTANSINGDIISTGFGGVRPGGNQTQSGGSTGTGVVTLTALKGNITVGDATTDFPTTGGVVFNGNNVSITVLGASTLVLGSNTTSSLAGNLTITSAIGSISNNGNVVVSGNASFTTGNGNISLNQAGNQFGTLKFSGNQVNVIQANDMKLLSTSSAIGASSLASGGSISIVNVSNTSASFGSTLSLIATGNITLPKLIQVGNTLTVNAAGTKDLSALSVSGDLGGKAPVNLGTGAYVAPQP